MSSSPTRGSDPANSEATACFELVIETDDERAATVLRRYWAASPDEAGRPEFHEQVKDIAADLGVPVAEVSQMARQSGYALEAGVVCRTCGDRWPRRTRSDRPQRWSHCERCETSQQQQQAAVAAAAQQQLANRQALLDAHLNRGELNGQAISVLETQVQGFDFTDVIDLLTWLRATGPSGVLVPIDQHEVVLFATTGRTESRLWKLGVLGIDPSTEVGAFAWDEAEGDSLPPFYASSARFFVEGVGSLRDRVEHAIAELKRALTGPWPMAWVDQCEELAKAVLAAEARRYLEHSIINHGLPVFDRDQAERFRGIAEDALDTYSLGQCYSFMWRAAKDGAAATKRHPMPLANGTSHAVNQFKNIVDRARQEKWEVTEYRPVQALPIAWQTQILFGHILGIEPISALIHEAKAIVRDRLGDEDTIQRLLAEGVPDDRARDALERLLARSSSGDQVDHVVEAALATAEAVLASGGSASDALRTAYFSIEILRGLSTWSAAALNEAQHAIATALRD